MKNTLILITAFALMLTAFLGLVNGTEGEILKTDPTGDYGEFGDVGDLVDNIDITQLRITYNSFPAMVYLKVAGDFPLELTTNYSYTFYILIDSTGDGEEDIEVSYMTILNMMSVSWADSDYGFLNETAYYEENSNTLVVELSETYFSSDTVYDIAATAMVMNMSDFSTAEDDLDFDSADDDDDWDDDDWDDDDDDWWVDDDEEFIDPATETPTDDSISVEIKDVSFDYDVSDEEMEIEIKISGTTEGDIHHCSNTMITYDGEGDPDEDSGDWSKGPDITERMTFMGYTMEMYFKGTGDGGDTDWSEWEFYMYMQGPYDENMTEDFDPEQIEEDAKMVHYVRAFADEDETKWNQDSRDVTKEIMDNINGGSDDSPMGTELVLLGSLIALSIGFFLYGRKK